MIDWSKAPKGATHYVEMDNRDSDFAFFKNDKYYCDNSYVGNYIIGEKYWRVVEAKPESKPVYTQAMCDAGELPSVGMECHIDGTGVVYIIVLPKDSEGDFILTPKEGDKYWQRSNIKYIKPIDTRTDEEKALDGLMDSYWDNDNVRPNKHSPICFDVLNAIKAGKIHGVTWSKS